jgi:hypothetical protein
MIIEVRRTRVISQEALKAGTWRQMHINHLKAAHNPGDAVSHDLARRF